MSIRYKILFNFLKRKKVIYEGYVVGIENADDLKRVESCALLHVAENYGNLPEAYGATALSVDVMEIDG